MRGTTRASTSGTATWPAWVPARSTPTGWTGPSIPRGTGLRFNRNKVLIDPYALGNINTLWDRNSAVGPEDNVATSMRSVVIDPTTYDWEGDRPLNIPLSETIIYEMHVRGFTKSPSSNVRHPGTFRGIIEKIPYLQVAGRHRGRAAADLRLRRDADSPRRAERSSCSPTTGATTPTRHCAPQSSYCVSPHLGTHLDEFRDMVKALHRPASR